MDSPPQANAPTVAADCAGDGGFLIPHQSHAVLFWRFLKFGLLAWGGPVAQLAMIRKELVEEEKWISSHRFNRALAVYQVLPGPEAHEMCVYFGMLARGRIGAILAGLGFMLPGFVLMMALSWVYVRFGIGSPLVAASFAAVQAAVVALIVRAVHRIGQHALTKRTLWTVAVVAGAAQLAGIHFGISLLYAGVLQVLLSRRRIALAALWTLVALGAAIVYWRWTQSHLVVLEAPVITGRSASLLRLAVSGFAAGVLTFGGAYTAIPYVQRDAVTTGGWMSNQHFLDGLALSGMLPAPLIIFTTFVGYVAGGPLGAIVMTIGVFLPAFSFTLIGHDFFERVTQSPKAHDFLDGVTAGVVGLIAATTIGLFRTAAMPNPRALAVFAGALIVLYAWNVKWAIAVVLAVAAIAGLLVDVR